MYHVLILYEIFQITLPLCQSSTIKNAHRKYILDSMSSFLASYVSWSRFVTGSPAWILYFMSFSFRAFSNFMSWTVSSHPSFGIQAGVDSSIWTDRPFVSQWRRSRNTIHSVKVRKHRHRLPKRFQRKAVFRCLHAGLRENIREDIDNTHTISWYMLILSQTSVEAGSFTYPFGGKPRTSRTSRHWRFQ